MARTRTSLVATAVAAVVVSSLTVLGVSGPARADTPAPLGLEPGDLVISDPGHDRLVVHPADGGADRYITGVTDPQGIVVTDGGDVVVIDASSSPEIVKFAADGTKTTLASRSGIQYLALAGDHVLYSGPGLGGIGRVSLSGADQDDTYIFDPRDPARNPNYGGIAVDTNGEVVAADTRDDLVVRIHGSGQDFTRTVVPELSRQGADTCSTPRPCGTRGLTLMRDGRIVVADTWNDRIWANGFGGNATTYGVGLADPTAVAVDNDTTIFATDQLNDRVVSFPPGPRDQFVVVTGLAGPTGIAVVPIPPASVGDVFVATTGGDVVRTHADGTGAVTVATVLGELTDVVVDDAGNAFAAAYDGTATTIHRIPADGSAAAPYVRTSLRVDTLAMGPFDSLYAGTAIDVERYWPGIGLDRMNDQGPVPGLAVDADGRVYAIAAGSLGYITGLSGPASVTPVGTGLSSSLAELAWDPAGRVVAVDPAQGQVVGVALDHDSHTVLADLADASDVTVTGSGGLLATSSGRQEVVAYAADGSGASTFVTLDTPAVGIASYVPTPSLTNGGPVPASGNADSAYAGHTFAAAENGGGAVSFSLYSGSLPPGLTLDAATGAVSGTPTTMGDYAFRVLAANKARGVVTDEQTVTIGKGLQSITFTSTAPTDALPDDTYTPTATGGGSGNAVTFSIDPGSSSICTYDSAAGTVTMLEGGADCTILADQAGNASYEAATTAQQRVFVDKFTQTVSFTSTAPTTATIGDTYTPTATATGGSAGAVPITVSGSIPTPPFTPTCSIDGAGVVHFQHAGTCHVTATKAGDDRSWAASETQHVTIAARTLTFAADAPAEAEIGTSYRPTTNYLGTPDIDVDATSDPGVCELNGVTGDVDFVAVGTCVISIDIAGDADYSPTRLTRTITVTRILQAIAFTTMPPISAPIGGAYTPAATGGASGNPVTFSIAPSSAGVCSLAGGAVRFDHAGSCVLRADQAGDTTHEPAPTATQAIVVARNPSSVTITSHPLAAVVGQQYAVTATTSPSGGSVRVRVASPPVCHATGTTVTFDHAGTCSVVVTWPGDADHDSSTATQTVAVSPATTELVLDVRHGSLAATVTVAAPAAGTPTGTVEFSEGDRSLGTAELTRNDRGDLVAVLDHPRPVGGHHEFAASYVGSGDYAASADTVAWTDPTITAFVTSRRGTSAFGWYRTPVTVTFACTAGSAPLVVGCPGPVVLRRDRRGSAVVVRVVTAADGGLARVEVSGIRIDRTDPGVRVKGARDGRTYGAERELRCVARDTLSGVDRCVVRQRRTAHGHRVVYRGIAWDRAGNKSVVKGRYFLR